MKTYQKISDTEIRVEETKQEIINIDSVKENIAGLQKQRASIVGEYQIKLSRIDDKITELQGYVQEANRLGIA